MFIAKRSSSFVMGGSVGVLFVICMDDLMYSHLQRNIVHPVRLLFNKPAPIETRDLIDIGTGVGRFANQMKPRATQRVSAKELLLDDGDYSTRQDHYFNYINQRLSQDLSPEVQHEAENEVIRSLNLENVLSPELIEKIESLREDPAKLAERDAALTPVHSKKDYAILKDITAGDVISSISFEHKSVKLDETRMEKFEDLVKIEAKKKRLYEKRAAKAAK